MFKACLSAIYLPRILPNWRGVMEEEPLLLIQFVHTKREAMTPEYAQHVMTT